MSSSSRLINILCGATLASALMLAAAYAVYVPLRVDSGWYTYPALALSQGRDPGENQLSFEQLLAGKPGVKARYFWDSRHNLYVLPTLFWFEKFGTSWRSIHFYGMAQFAIFAFVAWLLFTRCAGNADAGRVCWALLCADCIIVGNAASDGRPDLSIATLAMLLFLVAFSLLGDRPSRTPPALAGLLLAAILPLVHLTALVTIGVIGTFIFLMALRGRVPFTRIITPGLVVAIAAAVFFIRSPILDLLIPSSIAETFAQDPYSLLAEKLMGGWRHVLNVEVRRWSRYEWPSNGVQLALIGAGLFAALRSRRREPGKFAIELYAAAACGAITVAICSPSARLDHLITLMPFLLLATANALSGLEPRRLRSLGAAVLSATLLLKIAHGGYIAYRYGRQIRISNGEIESAFHTAFSGPGPYLVVGPAETWPYLPPGTNVVIDDKREGMFPFGTENWKRVSYVVLNADYDSYEWESRFQRQNPGLKLVPERIVGRREEKLFVALYRLAQKEP